MCTVGSGKTFTIEGAGQGEAQGIIPRAARMIFECESRLAIGCEMEGAGHELRG